ncbi:sigma 54-interacting transcriptional regulator [Rhodococcus aetherivorans]
MHEVDFPDPHDSIGLIVCSGATAELCNALDQARTGTSQILLVVPDGHAIDPWWALAHGANDCTVWNNDPVPVLARLDRLSEIEETLRSSTVAGVMIGTSVALRAALRELVIAARYGTAPLLLLGETGTGKELAARVAHALSPASTTGDLVVVDCTTIVPTLMGSELFGHERGAFTGAVSIRTGACAAADAGTLFLDEVGELPLELQPELMRVIQEGTYKRIGGDRWLRSRFRLICATNRDLQEEVRKGRFRMDLYYRIAATTVTLPPLRERIEDIIPLFCHFYRTTCRAAKNPVLDYAVEAALLERKYPGNLRDLKQLANRVAARHVGSGPITPGDIPSEDRPRPQIPSARGDRGARQPTVPNGAADIFGLAASFAVGQGMTLKEVKERIGDLVVSAALERSDGNIRAAAALLGITDRALYLRKAHRAE